MKRLLAMMLALTLVVSVFVGCGKKEEGTTDSKTEGTEQETTTEKEEPVELIWYTIGTPQQDMGKVNEKT